MEDYIYIQNMPLVRSLREENEKMKKKNKELKKKNKELSKLVKLVIANLDLLQQPLAKIVKPDVSTKIKTEPIYYSPYESETMNDDIEIVAPPLNEIINLSLINNEEEEDRFVNCDNCEISVDCHKNSIHIVYKGEPENLTDEKTLCTMCFHEQEDVLIEQGYNCDDWSIEEEEVEEVEEEEVEEEEVEEEVEEEEVEEEVEEEEVEEEVEEEEVEEEVEEGGNGGDSPVEEEGGNGGDSPVEEEDEVEEVTINGNTYYTTSTVNGLIYDVDEDGEISIEVGKYDKGKVVFYKK